MKGPRLLLPKYQNATAAIVVEKNKQVSIGSGSIVSHNGRTFVLTNRHVVDPSEHIVVKKLYLGDKVYPPASNLILSETDDLAAFPISVPDIHPRFFLGDSTHTLQEVVLFGFPKIPLTTKPHLTAHNGEINATIETWSGEQLYLVSNYASPGSSGGPLIDYRGLLIGVVSDSLEAQYDERSAFFQHSAAVTLKRVQRFVQNEVLNSIT